MKKDLLVNESSMFLPNIYDYISISGLSKKLTKGVIKQGKRI